MNPRPHAAVVLLVGAVSGLMGCDELGNPGLAAGQGLSLQTEVVTAKPWEAQQLLAAVPADALDYRDTSAEPGSTVALVRVRLVGERSSGRVRLSTLFMLEDGRRIARVWTMQSAAGPRYALFALPALPMRAQTQLIRR